MLIQLPYGRMRRTRFINTDQVSMIEMVGKDLYDVHIIGQEEPLSVETSDRELFRRWCGRIIEAPPGFSVVAVSLDAEDPAKPAFVSETPVIAFRFEGERCEQLTPITVEDGEPGDEDDWALLYPDGHLSNGFNYYKGKKKAVAEITKDLRRKQRLKSVAEQKQLNVVK